MHLIYIDSNKNDLLAFEKTLDTVEFISTYSLFTNASVVLDYANKNTVDVAFLDMELQGTKATNLAISLKDINPNIIIIYLTNDPNNAFEAYKTGGRAYLVKPYSLEELQDVFSFLRLIFTNNQQTLSQSQILTANNSHIFIKTFGNFDIFIDGIPVVFKNAKSKELLALLVDRKGSVLTNIEIFNYLWEHSEYNKSTATYVRKTVQILKKLLQEIGCEPLVSFHRNSFFINVSLCSSGFFSCDYYSILAGKTPYLNDYNGYYMSQYSWSEETIYVLENKLKELAFKNYDAK